MSEVPIEVLEMARRIAADTWSMDGENRQAVIDGQWDDIRQVRCAIAAIQRTTELAIKMAYLKLDDNWDRVIFQDALREFDHLKGRDYGRAIA